MAGVLIASALAFSAGPAYGPAQQLALRVDAALDRMAEPEFSPEQIDPYWTSEIAPYFEYEGLLGEADDLFGWGGSDYAPPRVVWEPQLDGASHNHLLGYTYCKVEVFINIRAANPVSSWYGWSRNPIATLTHEMIHTLNGDFCAPFDSETAESTTQTATLEVLAALANHGNTVALYALLLELRDGAMDVVYADALARDDVDGYRSFFARIFPDAIEQARFEKSFRFWSKDLATLKGILDRYSVLVFENMQKGQVVLDLPDGDSDLEVLVLDDLGYVLDHLEAMADDAGEEPV